MQYSAIRVCRIHQLFRPLPIGMSWNERGREGNLQRALVHIAHSPDGEAYDSMHLHLHYSPRELFMVNIRSIEGGRESKPVAHCLSAT